MNGVTGQVLEYVWRNSQITAIIVEFDDKNVGEKIIKENMDLDEVKKHSNALWGFLQLKSELIRRLKLKK